MRLSRDQEDRRLYCRVVRRLLKVVSKVSKVLSFDIVQYD